MPRTARSDRKPTAPGFTEPAVAAVFDAQPAAIRRQLLKLRTLILDTAAATPGRSLTSRSVILASALASETPETICFSMISSSSHTSVPGTPVNHSSR